MWHYRQGKCKFAPDGKKVIHKKSKTLKYIYHTRLHRRKMVHTGRRNKSEQGHMGDAWALEGDEGRDKLRKAAGIGKYESIRGYPNGATRYAKSVPFHCIVEGERGELKHLSTHRRRKQK